VEITTNDLSTKVIRLRSNWHQ